MVFASSHDAVLPLDATGYQMRRVSLNKKALAS